MTGGHAFHTFSSTKVLRLVMKYTFFIRYMMTFVRFILGSNFDTFFSKRFDIFIVRLKKLKKCKRAINNFKRIILIKT